MNLSVSDNTAISSILRLGLRRCLYFFFLKKIRIVNGEEHRSRLGRMSPVVSAIGKLSVAGLLLEDEEGALMFL